VEQGHVGDWAAADKRYIEYKKKNPKTKRVMESFVMCKMCGGGFPCTVIEIARRLPQGVTLEESGLRAVPGLADSNREQAS
jgi:hypothetical protein